MANEAIKSQLQTLGVDDGIIKDIISTVKPDPITGKIGVDALMKYIMESTNPQVRKVLQNGAKLVEQQRRETSVDWATVNFNKLPIQDNVTWWLRLTTLPDGGITREPTRSMLECMTYGTKIDAPRLVDKYKDVPTSEELLHFIRRCMAKPLPGLDPSLPNILIIQRNLRQHTTLIKPFLDSLPSPFKWAIESEFNDSESHQQSNPTTSGTSSSHFGNELFSYDIAITMAEQAKAKGNTAHGNNDRTTAIKAYTEAIDKLMNAFRSDPNREKDKRAEKLLAVCCANRAASHLLPGDDMDPHEAWKDGEVAIRANPSYAKGYIRVSRAHQELGNLKKAKESITRGLRSCTDLSNEPGLVDRLIELQTDGKGLPENEEEFLAWKELVLVEDEDSAKMMEGVRGLWQQRMEEHLVKLKEVNNDTGEMR